MAATSLDRGPAMDRTLFETSFTVYVLRLASHRFFIGVVSFPWFEQPASCRRRLSMVPRSRNSAGLKLSLPPAREDRRHRVGDLRRPADGVRGLALGVPCSN